jgi:hypothetical protein
VQLGINVVIFFVVPTFYSLTLTFPTFATNAVSVVYLTTFDGFLNLPASIVEFFFITDCVNDYSFKSDFPRSFSSLIAFEKSLLRE